MEGQKRLDHGPKFVGNQFFCHARVLPNMAFLLGPLRVRVNVRCGPICYNLGFADEMPIFLRGLIILWQINLVCPVKVDQGVALSLALPLRYFA